jgi:hypothetical protein
MDEEVTSFVSSLGANLRKPDLEQHIAWLQKKDPAWIEALQTSLSTVRMSTVSSLTGSPAYLTTSCTF